MPGGKCRRLEELPAPARAIVDGARRAVLATVDEHGAPHAVPVTFAVVAGDFVSAIDDKPKSSQELARVRNVRARPVATLLMDRWSEQWEHLGWVMVTGGARVEPPGTGVAQLVERYEQYRGAPPRGDVIVLAPERIRWWLFSAPDV